MTTQTNQEILTKAIEKTIDSGWDFFNHQGRAFKVLPANGWGNNRLMVHSLRGNGKYKQYACDYEIIFNKDFAKALWGERLDEWLVPMWETRLKAMVIADDPVKYLGENI